MPDEARPGAEPSEAPKQPPQHPSKPRVATARKRGVVARATDVVLGPLSGLRLPPLDWKIVTWGLVALIAIILVARNWAPVRLNIFGWYLDLPKALAFVLFFALGALCMWLRELRGPRFGRAAPKARPAEVPSEPAEEEDVEIEAEFVAEDEEPAEGPSQA